MTTGATLGTCVVFCAYVARMLTRFCAYIPAYKHTCIHAYMHVHTCILGLQVADRGVGGLQVVCLNVVDWMLRAWQLLSFRRHLTLLVLDSSFSPSRLSDSGLSAFRLSDSGLLRDAGLRVADRRVVGLRVVGRRVIGFLGAICRLLIL